MRSRFFFAAIVAALLVAVPAAADTFTDAQVAAAAKLRYESPATQRAMQAHIPTLMNWVDAADTTFSGVLGSIHSPVADITALKAIPATGATARADKQVCLVEAGPTSGQALYVFDSGSSAAGNNNTVVQPASGTGRWIKVADLADTAMLSVLISTSNGFGASLVGIEDAAPGYFTGTTVEAGMREKAIALAALEAKVARYQKPVIAQWDPTGPIDPPTSNTGDRYIAEASAGAYTVWRIYEYNGTAWVETTPVNGDVTYNLDTDKVLAFNGAMWDSLADTDAFTGDSGSGGAKGLVPAPATGDAAAGKYLKADGTWAVPPTSAYECGTGSDGDSDDSITLDKDCAILTTKSLTTAAETNYTLTWATTSATATTPALCQLAGGTNTKEVGILTVSPGVGSVSIVIRNYDGAAALDGTVIVSCVVF